jgi:hypothetical protein
MNDMHNDDCRRLLYVRRRCRAVAGWAITCAVLTGSMVTAAWANEAEVQEVQKGGKAQQRAAEKQRQKLIAQLVQDLTKAFQPILQSELEIVRKTCGNLSAEARQKIVAAGNEAVKAAARQFAVLQVADQGLQGFDPRKSIGDAVAAAVKPHAAEEEFAAYEREQAARVARRVRAARMLIIVKLDSELDLSQSQRKKIEADLEQHWEAGWLRELDDFGTTQLHTTTLRLAPDFADKWIAPHLDVRQQAKWKQWCQQDGWSRKDNHLSWSSEARSLPPDSWWSE